MLKVYKKDGAVSVYKKQSKMAFSKIIGRVWGEKYNLHVYYKPRLTNEGTYYNKKDLKHAFKAFTEKPLLDDVEKWNE